MQGSFHGLLIIPVKPKHLRFGVPHNLRMSDSHQKTLESAVDQGEWMSRGTALHAAGQLENALMAFEHAYALNPLDPHAVTAYATLLSLLDRPQAAYKILQSVQSSLMQNADGAANLAIAAEACGDMTQADVGYARALELDPNHLRSLNNVGILAATSSQWDMAISLARRCVSLQPEHAPYYANLAEYLYGSKHYAQALEVTQNATAQFPEDIDLKIRHIVLLAICGELEKSDLIFKSLDEAGHRHFDKFLLKLEAANNLHNPVVLLANKQLDTAFDALQLYTAQAFHDLSAGDWRGKEKLTATLRDALHKTAASNDGRDWGHAAFYGAMLDLQASELAQIHRESMAAISARLEANLAVFKEPLHSGTQQDKRISIGLAVQNLNDARQLQALKQQLARHDASLFALHVYAFTLHPDAAACGLLKPHAASVNEMGHMTHAEATARIRLDKLDLFIDMAFEAQAVAPSIAVMRVAPVQLLCPSAFQTLDTGLWHYRLSDHYVQPDAHNTDQLGEMVRLPHTCWLASANAEIPVSVTSRKEVSLPEDKLLLCAVTSPATLDSQSFSLWMKILRSLPDAVLWLPYCGKAAPHLVREAQAVGVAATRLLFSTPMSHSEAASRLQHADLVLDTLRFNATQGMEDALRLGVPAISCSGSRMASRLGGSMLRAAGLPECVFDSQEAYVAEAIRLGRHPGVLQSLRERVQACMSTAPLFDLSARVKDWETAWAMMVKRSRAGLPPAPFDVTLP